MERATDTQRARKKEEEKESERGGGTNEGEMKMNAGEERVETTREIMESLLA